LSRIAVVVEGNRSDREQIAFSIVGSWDYGLIGSWKLQLGTRGDSSHANDHEGIWLWTEQHPFRSDLDRQTMRICIQRDIAKNHSLHRIESVEGIVRRSSISKINVLVIVIVRRKDAYDKVKIMD
jgi:hypothetical protein